MITRNELKNMNINTLEDVRTFVSYVINDLKCNYHPDDSFGELVNANFEQVFDSEAIKYLDDLNHKCFEIAGDEYYDIACDELDKYLS